jgi:exosortase
VASIALHVAGILGSETFLSRVAMIVALVGTILYVWGRSHLRVLAFPVLFLLLAIPIPKLLFYEIAFPLQLLASQFGEWVLTAADVPVLREGNVLVLATTTLEVADACSGIRSLVSLMAVGVVYAYFTERRRVVRALLVVATVPIAIITNGLRIAGTGLAAAWVGADAAQTLFHTFSGWIVFVAAVAMLVAVHQVTARLAGSGQRHQPPAGEATR